MSEISNVNDGGLNRQLVESIRRMSQMPAQRVRGGNRFSYTVTAEDGMSTAKQIMKRRLGFSGRLISSIKQGGIVFRNGTPVRIFADVIPGDVIEVILPEERSSFPPQDIPIEVVYEDDDMLLLNKQPWVVVHPTMGHPVGTIANGLAKRMEDTGIYYKIRFVNRLDRDTGGLLIVAKNSHCQDVLSQDMKSNLIEKRYKAVAHGIFEDDEGVINLPIGRRSPDDIERCVMEDGYPSVTHYKVLERFSEGSGIYEGGFTFLELRLETGRTHQIRVHMSHMGHALVGDPLYGAEEPELLDRQALHAAQLKLRQPVSRELLDVKAPLPEDMKNLILRLRENCISHCIVK